MKNSDHVLINISYGVSAIVIRTEHMATFLNAINSDDTSGFYSDGWIRGATGLAYYPVDVQLDMRILNKNCRTFASREEYEIERKLRETEFDAQVKAKEAEAAAITEVKKEETEALTNTPS